jgi:hypothetical protein
MKQDKLPLAKTTRDLTRLLNLNDEDAVEIDLRIRLNDKIIDVAKRRKLTHAAVAKLARTSRTKITALLNRNRQSISTSLMIRVLAALGVRVKISFTPMRVAA